MICIANSELTKTDKRIKVSKIASTVRRRQMNHRSQLSVQRSISLYNTHTHACMHTPASLCVAVSSLHRAYSHVAFRTFYSKNILIFSIGSGQPREPALCQLYRHTFVPYYIDKLFSSVLFIFRQFFGSMW